MLIESISSTEAKPIDQDAAVALISVVSRSRTAASSFFESSMPGIREPGANTTAAADTGPERAFVPQQLAQPLTLRSVFEASPRDGVQDRLGARA